MHYNKTPIIYNNLNLAHRTQLNLIKYYSFYFGFKL